MTPEDFAAIQEQPQVRRGLFLIRLADLDPESRFHQELLYSLEACQPGATDGELITAIRFIVGQTKGDALEERAQAKIAAKRKLRVEARRFREEGRVSQSAAERMVEEDPAYWDLKLREELADARATACTDLLFALQAATDTWRTHRADEREADQWHAQTGT